VSAVVHRDLEGKVAVISGASQGMGLAIAERFIGAGATVFGAALDDPGVEGLTCLVEDLRTAAGCAALVARAVDDAGGIDIVVNNVGGLAQPRAGITEVSDEEWQVTFDLNLFSAVRIIRAAMPRLLERGGRIVNVSSVAAVKPEPNIVDYSAAKAALNAYTKALSEEFGPKGVRVNTVTLGSFKTPAWTADGALGDQLAAAMGLDDRDKAMQLFLEQLGGVTLNRWGDPAEVAAAVHFLVSSEADYINGADLRIDGGLYKGV
jgi:putative oxidoreductase